MKDRAKDIIISGGENISSIEVENVLAAHPAVREAAVVAVAHPHSGERPVAFVALHANAETAPGELRSFLRARLARFKVPDRIETLEALPRTSTGKILKRELRDRAKAC